MRHPAAAHVLAKASRELGAAATEGVSLKERRYPPRAGKAVLACAVETWGYADPALDALLAELAVLAAQRQRDRGVQPTRWQAKWRTLISVHLAMAIAKAMLAAISCQVGPCCVIRVQGEAAGRRRREASQR